MTEILKEKEQNAYLSHRRGPPRPGLAQPTSGLVVFYPASPSCSLERGARRRHQRDDVALLGLHVPSASAKISPRTFSSFPLHVRFLSSSLHRRFAHGRRAHRSAAAAPAWPTASGRHATLSRVTSVIDLFALEEES